MTETKTYCDHCFKEINNMVDYLDVGIEFNHLSINTDLCESCFNELFAIATTFCGKEGEE